MNDRPTALPILSATGAVLRLAWSERRRAVLYAAVPFGVMAALDVGGTLAGVNVLNEQWWIVTASLVSLIVFAPLTVSWFRHLVEGETAGQRPLFTLGAPEWHVIRLNILISFILVGSALVGGGLATAVGAAAAEGGKIVSTILLGLVALAAIFGIGILVTRLTMAVAYAALGRDIDLRMAWTITEGFAVRMTLLHAIMAAVAFGTAQVVYVVQDLVGASAGVADESQAGGWTLFTSVTATLASVLFMLLVTALFAYVVRKIDHGDLGTGMGLLAPGDRSATKKQIKDALTYIAKVRAEGSKDTIADFRALIDKFGSHFPLPAGTAVTKVECDGVGAVWIDVPGVRNDQVVLYFHGGGFMAGSSVSHARAAADVGAGAAARVLVVDYRRAPEHPFPAAVDDCTAAYAWLLSQGIKPDRIAFAGDSAGGGLVVSAMLKARAQGLPRPSSGVCLSPWVDLACSGDTYRLKKKDDPIGTHESLSGAAKNYLRDTDPSTPLASPIHADLTGLPPLLIQVGSREVLLGDAITLARAARQAGVPVAFEQWPGMIHNWHMLADLIDDGRYANLRIGEFVRATWH